MTQQEYWDAREEIEEECDDWSAKQSAIRELDAEFSGPDYPNDGSMEYFLMIDLSFD